MNLAQHPSARLAASTILGLLLAVVSPTGHAQRYSFQTIAGGHDGDGGAALDATVQRPSGVVFDAQGNLFVADFGRHRIRKVTPGGTITTAVGTGVAGYSGDGGSDPANSRVHSPSGLALDAAGNLYFSDAGNHRIRRLGTDGSLTLVAGSGSSTDSGDGGAAIAAGVGSPAYLTFDPDGNLYVSQTARHKVRKISPGGIITTVAGNGSMGNSGDGGAAVAAKIGYPMGLAVDAAGNLLISQNYNDLIRSVSPAGIISTAYSDVPWPYALLFDAVGNLYVGSDCAIYRLDPLGTRAIVAGNEWPESCAYSGDGGPAVGAGIFTPDGMALAADGSLWFADYGHARVRRIADGTISTVVGRGSPYGDGGPAAEADFSALTGIGTGPGGAVLVADAYPNSRVRAITGARMVSTLAGTGEMFLSDGDYGPATAANLNYPFDAAMDAAGNAYLVERSSARVRRVTPEGIIEPVIEPGTQSLARPTSIAIDGAGNLYVADSGRRKVFKRTPAGQLTVIAGSDAIVPLGDGGPATAAYVPAISVAVDAYGNVYIGDDTGRVRKVGPDGIIRTVAGNGQSGFSGDNGLARSAAIGRPTGIAVAPNGDLFIASGPLRKVSKGGQITTLYELEYPAYDVAIGKDGKLYVASLGGRVLEGRPIASPTGPLPDKGK